MSGNLFWCRRVRLTLGSNKPPNTAITIGSDAFDSDFRIDFRVEKTRDATSNKAVISVYNLSLNERNTISSEYDRVRLTAGYQGETPIDSDSGFWGDLINGFITKITHERRGVDIVTKLECVDSHIAQSSSVINRTFEAGVSHRFIIEDIVSTMDNVIIGDISGIPSNAKVVSGRGRTFSTTSKKAIKSLAETHQSRMTINNGVLEIIANDSGIREGYRVPLISKDSGLINGVSYTEKGVNFNCLLHPHIEPNRFVIVRDEELGVGRSSQKIEKEKKEKEFGEDRVYRVNKVVFSGTTGNGNFQCNIEGQRADGYVVSGALVDRSPVSTSLKNTPLPDTD